MRPSNTLKESTWSIKGLLFGWFFGVLKVCTSISLISFRWGLESNPPSNESKGRENFKQLPVSFSSSVVWMLFTRNFSEGPFGVLQSQRKRSFYLCCSKNIKLLHDKSKQSSLITSLASFRSTLDSLLVFGIRLKRSRTKWRILPAMPREHTTSVLSRFFHSLVWGSASLKAPRVC